MRPAYKISSLLPKLIIGHCYHPCTNYTSAWNPALHGTLRAGLWPVKAMHVPLQSRNTKEGVWALLPNHSRLFSVHHETNQSTATWTQQLSLFLSLRWWQTEMHASVRSISRGTHGQCRAAGGLSCEQEVVPGSAAAPCTARRLCQGTAHVLPTHAGDTHNRDSGPAAPAAPASHIRIPEPLCAAMPAIALCSVPQYLPQPALQCVLWGARGFLGALSGSRLLATFLNPLG